MEGGVGGQLRAFGKDARSGILGRILRGDVGYLQVFLALGLIWTVFQLANDRFLTATNLTNLLLQVTAIGIISIGVVLVLLLGEIDLSIGFVGGIGGTITAELVKQGWDWPWCSVSYWPRWSSRPRGSPWPAALVIPSRPALPTSTCCYSSLCCYCRPTILGTF